MHRYFYIAIFILGMLGATPLQAQNGTGIVAVVNNDIISAFDLESRINIVIAFSQLPNTPETKKRLARQILNNLVVEKLKSQQTNEVKVIASEDDINRALSGFEKRNGIPKGGLNNYLRSNGLNKTSLKNQFKANMEWRSFITKKYGQSIHIDDEEVDAILQDIKNNEGKPEYLLAEIFLAVDNPANAPKVAAQAQNLIKQLRTGANFKGLATNFSQSPMAAVAGDLGWVRQGQLEKPLLAAVLKMKPGQITSPIQGVDGYYILALRDQRISSGLTVGNKAAPTLTLYQLHLAHTQNDKAAKINLSDDIRSKSKSCSDMEALGKKLGSPLSGNLGTHRLDKLSAQLQKLLATTKAGEISELMHTPNGISMFMVCDRKDPVIEDPVNKFKLRTKNKLRSTRLNHFSRQDLRNLRRTAFIEIRL